MLIILVGLDGGHWTGKINRSTPSKNAISVKELPDQKIITRLSCLIDVVNRMKCSQKDCSGVLVYNGFMPNACRLTSSCSVCRVDEFVNTAQLCTLKHDDDQNHRQVADIPYQAALASKLIPGGGAATQGRMNAILGLSGLSETSLTSFYHGPLLRSVRTVSDKSIKDNLPRIIENSLKRDPKADGVKKFYPVAMSVDCRWDKPWGWNAMNSTVRMIETTSNTVMATITLHRKDSSENRFEQSAKSCDAEGSALCLVEVTKLGFDVVEIIHDDDSSSMKRMRECKAELAKKPEYEGKITSTIKETLCIRYVFSFFVSFSFFYFDIFSFCRHAGKHVGDAINKLACESVKSLKKTRPSAPTKLAKKPSKGQKEAFNSANVKYTNQLKSYQAAVLELKVLQSNKAYNYFKKAWKVSLIDAKGDLNVAKKHISNILVHLDERKECVNCSWHSKDYSQSFGPFSTPEALSVVKIWCDKYTADDVLMKYLSTETTNYNEYINSLEGYFNLKIKHCGSDKGYDVYAFYVSALANLGPLVDKLVTIELGLPWEATQERLLQQRIDAFNYNSERKKSECYLTSRAIAKQRRKDDTAVGKKDQNYKSVAIAKENDKQYKRAIGSETNLYSMDGTNKLRTRENYNEGELIFMAFGKFWHYGIVMQFKEEDLYLVYFLDGDCDTYGSYEFRRINQMNPKDLVWIARNRKKDIHEEFSLFQPKLEQFDTKLRTYYNSNKGKK